MNEKISTDRFYSTDRRKTDTELILHAVQIFV